MYRESTPRGDVMTRSQRIGFLSLAAVILVVAVVVLGTGSDDKSTSTPAATTTASVTSAATVPGATTTAATPPLDPGPLLVAGKVQKIKVHKGDQVRLRVRSAVADELHVHGYDL